MGIFGISLAGGSESGKTSSTTKGTKTTQKQLSQEGIDKLIYDVLSADQGLASILSAENASGGYGSSSKTLMAQDFITKVIGEIANITAPTVESIDSKTTGSSKKKSGGAKTVICTYLVNHGYMPLDLYLRGILRYWELPEQTLRGYHIWANPVVKWMKTRPWLCRLLAPVAIKRYKYAIDQDFTVTGWISVHIAEPVCYLIGWFVPTHTCEEIQNG
jgi:hypothetical protein